MKRTLIASFIVLAVSAPALAQENYPLADKIPADCLFYAGWAGKTKAFDESPLAAMMNSPQAKNALNTLNDLLQKNQPKAAEHFKNILSTLDMIWPHQAAIALLELEKSKDSNKPTFSLAAIIDMGQDKDLLVKKIDEIFASAKTDTQPKSETIASIPVKKIEIDKNVVVYMGWQDNLFIISLASPGHAEKAFQKVGDKSLNKDEKFLTAMKEVSGSDSQCCIFGNIKTIKDVAMPTTTESERMTTDRFLSVMGTDKATAVAASIKLADKSIYYKKKIFTPAPHEGLICSIAGKPLTDDDLSVIPEDADFFFAANASPAAIMDELLLKIADFAPEGVNSFERQLQMMGETFGISIKDDLIASLDGPIILCSAQSQGGWLTGTVLSIKIKDKDKFATAMNAINDFLKKEFGNSDDPSRSRYKPKFTTAEYNKTEIYTLNLGKKVPYVSPSWAAYGDRLLIAPYPQTIQTTIARFGAKPITKNPEFKNKLAKFSGKPAAIGYINSLNMTKQLYPFILIAGSSMSNMLPEYFGQTGLQAPALSDIEGWMSPEIYAVSTDQSGILVEGITGGPSLLTSGPILIPTMLVALGKARQDAKRAASASNLGSIAKAVALYRGEYNDRPPINLGMLCAKGLISPKALVSPSGTKAPPEVDTATGEITGDTDYVYFEVLDTAPGDTIMAYEKPELYNNEGTNVLSSNCSVRWVNMETFKKLMEESKKYHDEGKGKGYNYLTDK